MAPEGNMLFGVSFCRRRTFKRKRSTGAGAALALLLCALILTALLFLAPQWLLVVLVLGLTAAVVVLARGRG